MPTKAPDGVRTAILSAIEASLDAQLRAVRRLRVDGDVDQRPPRKRIGRSQVDVAEDVLRRAGEPLHVSEIVSRAKASLGVELDRESLVSALTKKIIRGVRFVRVGPNEFALKPGGR